MSRSFCVGLALLLYAAPVASSSSPNAVSVAIDVTKPGVDFPHFWKRCVGSGHMLLGTRADWQKHLALARKGLAMQAVLASRVKYCLSTTTCFYSELGFEMIRGHGLLDDDMSTMMGQGEYSFTNVDIVFDYLLTLGLLNLCILFGKIPS